MRYDSEEESADRHAGLRTRALPVADFDFDFDAPPMDGLEYLAFVRAEAATVPDVMVCSDGALTEHNDSSRNRLESLVNTSAVTSQETPGPGYKRFSAAAPVLARAAASAPASAPQHASVSPAWRREFLSWFSDVRADVGRLVARRIGGDGVVETGFGDFGDGDGDRGGRSAGYDECASFTERAAYALEAANREEDDGTVGTGEYPVLSQIADADEVSTAHALRQHADAIEDRFFTSGGVGVSGDGDADGETVEKCGIKFSKIRAAWFFALAARVDVPLDADTSAAMRAAARGLAAARAGTTSARDPILPDLQVCLAIAGGYFGQDGA